MTKRRRGLLAAASSVVLVASGIALLLLAAGNLPISAASAAALILGWGILAVYCLKAESAKGEVEKLRKEIREHDERELDRTRRLEEAIEAERAKESTHEYHMEQSLNRIESRAAELAAQVRARSSVPRRTNLDVLFVTSNGAGLGHLSRLLAIAQRLDDGTRVEFLTLSTAYRTFADSGFVIHYFPSADAADISPARWNHRFAQHFADLIREIVPRVVVFDGTWVYNGLTEVCRSFGIPLVWVQRGNWREEVDRKSTQRHSASSVADEVIVPGDFAVREHIDVGKDITPIRVGPIVQVRRSQLLSRQEALGRLGLDPQYRYVLANLGGGILGDAEESLELVRETVESLGGPWRLVTVRSPLASSRRSDAAAAIEISAYPVSKFSRGFEFIVSAAGYNSVQEAISLGVPTIIVPNEKAVTDDQTARAQGASDSGLALTAGNSAELKESILELADSNRRQALLARLNDIDEASGASEAASALASIIARSKWDLAAETIGVHDD